MMGDKKLFNYYKNLAYITLPEMSKSKSYPYYYAVVMYYMGYEWEALKALKNQNPYIKRSNQLKSAIYEYYNNYALAQELENNPFYKGLSLAEIGEYQLARRYLTLSKNPKAKFALGLVDLKLSLFKEASKYIKEPNYYPIRMYLKKSLFDVKVAQKDFAKTFLKTNKDFYDLFFYFAPYKVFNLNQTINFLKKGVAGIPIGAIKESKNYLYKSATSSALNIEISKALRLAINGHIYLSNKYFLKLLKKKPTSYILQYNLALTYAQMGDYAKAYEHFLRAYHLNPKDIYSGLYALMALDKLDKNNKYLLASIKEDLDKNSSLVLAVIQNNTVEMSRALEEKAISDPTILVARIASEMILGRDPQNDALILKNMYPKDIVANILYFYSTHLNEPVNRIALDFQALFFGKDWSMNEFYYGSFLAREWLFKFAKISGLLNSLREEILIKAKEETFDLIPVLKRLAFANLYTKHFEEAYVIYNDLINNKNISDPATLYNAAVAAVGANHHANAVALMELAKLKNPSYYEARYGLGLLWQEANNLRAAKIQYIRIPDGFKSKFFDFNIAKKE
jgi:tetratricopeptide (TPR) repeat protein